MKLMLLTFLAGVMVLVVLFLPSYVVSEIPAFRSIYACVPNGEYVSVLYKAVLVLNTFGPIILVFFLRAERIFSEVKHLFSSLLVFCVALMGLYVGVPVRNVDGAAVAFSGIFCQSTMGAIFVVLMIGIGTFFCILYFLYSSKCFLLLRNKGK